MEKANALGGPTYYHNVDPQTLAEMVHNGAEPTLGYANPTYFERLDKFTWRLLPNISATTGILEFLNPTLTAGDNPAITITECQTAIQAVFYHSILKLVGQKRFDKLFGEEKVETPSEQRLKIEFNITGANPLNNYLIKDKAKMDKEEYNELKHEENVPVSSPGFRPAKLGGWYFIKNHPLFNIRHSLGIWGGENALYVGRNDDNEQIFSGFGLENRTEKEMAQCLADEFNSPPNEQEVADIITRDSAHLSLILPTLGEIGTINELPNLSEAAITALDTLLLWKRETKIKLDERAIQLDVILGLLKDKELQPQVLPNDLLDEIHLSAEQNEPLPLTENTTHGVWVAHEDSMRLKWSNKKLKRISIRTLMGYYASSFNLHVSPLLRELIKEFNAGFKEFAETKTFAVKPGQEYLFPLPSEIIKLKKSPSGFQSLGAKIIDPDKIMDIVKNT
ncbi:hypothetical protein [Pedobacter sp. NJ-S-72]